MTTSMTLESMVDMAIGSPEVGAVNFNVMKTLFHSILQK